MSETKIPGICGAHAIISKDCTDAHGDEGAFNEAVRRLREVYGMSLEGWRKQGKQPKIHLAITIEIERPE